MPDERVILHPGELASLRALPFLGPVRKLPVRLGGPMESHPRRAEWERQLNRGIFACGCDTSAKFLLAGTVVVAAGLWIRSLMLTQWPPLGWSAALLFASAIAFATLGKFWGLFRADRSLLRVCKTIAEEWPR